MLQHSSTPMITPESTASTSQAMITQSPKTKFGNDKKPQLTPVWSVEWEQEREQQQAEKEQERRQAEKEQQQTSIGK
jgi:hypothetical protein